MVVSSTSSSSYFSILSPVTVIGSMLAVSLLTISTIAILQWQRKNHSQAIFEEGKGNVDGDVLLPSKDDNKNNHHRPTLEDEMLAAGDADGNMSLTIHPIGVVRSVYRLCVGTPRQGLLAPHARGRIDLTNDMTKDAVLGLQEYSHIWIIFIFHLNTLPKEPKYGGDNNNNNMSIRRRRAFPLKISPPALGGSRKVGVLSTRSPHRPNPIGMTLARLDRIETKKMKCTRTANNGATTTTSLFISGLDLVDGTPVIDIKPYVPHYDSPYPLSLLPPPLSDKAAYCDLPPWVADGLATKRSVIFLPQALSDLQTILEQNPKNALEFYGIGKCGDATILEVTDSIKACIEEVLAIDVRSRWQSNKARSGRFQAQRAHRVQQTFASSTTGAGTATDAATDDDDTEDNNIDSNDQEMETTCTQQLDRLLIHYNVSVPDEMNRPTSSTGSGAEDVVQVLSIELLQQVHVTKP